MQETKTDSRAAKKLEIVRALLSKADGTNFPAEADAFRAKADAIMVQFAIEMWQVDAAQDGTNASATPVKREFDFGWWYTSTHKDDLWRLFLSTAHHCRCVVAIRGQNYKSMPVIGLPSDLDYLDMLFTHLMLQMAKQLEPKPDPALSYGENCYNLRAAGLQRVRTIELLYKAGMIPGTDSVAQPWETIYVGQPGKGGRFIVGPGILKDKQFRAKVALPAEKWAKDHGLDSTATVNPVTWQRSFSQGFVSEIGYRMTKMRRDQQGPGGDGSSTALAIRDIRQVAVDLYNEMFPPPKPVAVTASTRKGRSVARTRDVAFSDKAYGAGTAAGKRANLSANPNSGLGGNRKGLK